jgi:hypothetical protein
MVFALLLSACADDDPVVHEAVGPTVDDVEVSHPYEPANTMMYAVTVKLSDHADDADHDVAVGYAPAGTDCATGSWTFGPVQRFAIDDSMSSILYGFQPGVAYDYKVQVGAEGDTRCGELGMAVLPGNLAALNLTYTKTQYATRYALVDTDDCGYSTDGSSERRMYVIAIDADTEQIVWYLDVAARSTIGGKDLTGWRYQAGDPGRFLGTVDKRYVYEWAWDGTVLAARDVAGDGCDGSDAYGPCVHHDAFRSDVSGNVYVVASEQSSFDLAGTPWDQCATGSRLLDDGFQIWNADLSASETKSMMRDLGYDPAEEDVGPNIEAWLEQEEGCDATLWRDYFDPYATIDWTHLNSIAASSFGGTEVIDLSLKGWDQVVRIDESGALLWRLSSHAAYSDFGTLQMGPGITGEAAFGRQHDVHAVADDTLLMFDNVGDRTGSRVLRIHLDSALQASTIDRSWALVDGAGNALGCRIHGSAQPVPGTDGETVLTICNDERTVVELDDATGSTRPPPLTISLPDALGPDGFCTAGGPTTREGIHGWYRAYPADSIGDFAPSR